MRSSRGLNRASSAKGSRLLSRISQGRRLEEPPYPNVSLDEAA